MGSTTPSGGEFVITAPREEVQRRIKARIQEAQPLLEQQVSTEEQLEELRSNIKNWTDYNFRLLSRLFVDEQVAKRYGSEGGFSVNAMWQVEDWADHHRKRVARYCKKLLGIIEQLEFYDSAPSAGPSPAVQSGATQATFPVTVIPAPENAPPLTQAEKLKWLHEEGARLTDPHLADGEGYLVDEEVPAADAWAVDVQEEFNRLYSSGDARRREFGNLRAQFRKYRLVCDLEQMQALLQRAIAHAERPAWELSRPAVLAAETVQTDRVFIIHGHDTAALLELQGLLKDHFHLDPVVLKEKPSLTNTVVEKFERIAGRCGYAIAIFTPDDLVTSQGDQYSQPRPNVLVELGWFWGRRGRDRTMIIYKGDAKLPSDLGGIVTISLGADESLGSKFLEMQRELRAAQVVA